MPSRIDAGTGEGDSILDAGLAGDPAVDLEALPKPARRLAGEPESAQARIFRTYTAARAALGVALVAGIGATSLVNLRAPLPIVLLCLGYALQAVLLWLLPGDRAPAAGAPVPPRPRWWSTIGVDVGVFTALHALASDISLNFAALLVLPVLMAGVLTSRLGALATAAGAALALLGVAWQAAGGGAGGALLITQSGLAGLGLFLIALLSGELAGRLAREEIAARGSLELARQQAQLNRLVIEEMADGVLVVDRELRVRASNPAARSLLAARGTALGATFALHGRAEWSVLAAAVQRALARGRWPDAGEEVTLAFGAGDNRTLRMRVRFTRRRPARRDAPAIEELCVLLLEDVRTAQARLRQEKLAAMGRVSAGIAHEIRNPLAAIAQANALLLEDPLPDAQRRLARMVADNVERLRRIVDDVMETAPGTTPPAEVIEATAEVGAAAVDWARTAGIETAGRAARLRLDLPKVPLRVRFDREHLRRVLVNLLDNAKRHASDAPGAIGLRLAARDQATVLLLVDSDGPPIAPEVERHLFEPFFSTRSRGTGLGLYICRELCQRYGASIEYRLRPDGQRNLFLVIMRRDAAAVADPSPAA
ncbi:MAG: histidine kinase [Burkholderiales bacterium]|nr:histidine kinase [Burkholderiales bacterium]